MAWLFRSEQWRRAPPHRVATSLRYHPPWTRRGPGVFILLFLINGFSLKQNWYIFCKILVDLHGEKKSAPTSFFLQKNVKQTQTSSLDTAVQQLQAEIPRTFTWSTPAHTLTYQYISNLKIHLSYGLTVEIIHISIYYLSIRIYLLVYTDLNDAADWRVAVFVCVYKNCASKQWKSVHRRAAAKVSAFKRVICAVLAAKTLLFEHVSSPHVGLSIVLTIETEDAAVPSIKNLCCITVI